MSKWNDDIWKVDSWRHPVGHDGTFEWSSRSGSMENAIAVTCTLKSAKRHTESVRTSVQTQSRVSNKGMAPPRTVGRFVAPLYQSACLLKYRIETNDRIQSTHQNLCLTTACGSTLLRNEIMKHTSWLTIEQHRELLLGHIFPRHSRGKIHFARTLE